MGAVPSTRGPAVSYTHLDVYKRQGQTSSKTPWMFKDNLSSWTWPGFEGQTASVDVYSASEEVLSLIHI